MTSGPCYMPKGTASCFVTRTLHSTSELLGVWRDHSGGFRVDICEHVTERARVHPWTFPVPMSPVST